MRFNENRKASKIYRNELNSVKKNNIKWISASKDNVPDVYEIGMSHLGIRFIDMFNKQTHGVSVFILHGLICIRL